MAKNLRKFVNPRFTNTVDLGLLRRLLDRHAADLHGLDLALLDGEPDTARAALREFFAGAEDRYPEGLVADLHRIAELGNANGLRLLQEQAGRRHIPLAPQAGADEPDARLDPKHVALRVFLEHPAVFNAAADMLALEARVSLAEFAGIEEGIEARIDEHTRAAFEGAAARLFEADLRGRYCRIGWYDDDDEINIVVTHGAPVTTTPIVENGEERVISFRAAENAVLSYAAGTGRLKVGGVAKARRAELAEIFAATMLNRPGFFAAPDAQNLYTLAPVERAGFDFAFDHAFDAGIRRVQIVEVQADRIGTDPHSGEACVLWSLVTRDRRESALARLPIERNGRAFDNAWRLNHMVIRVHIDAGARRPACVTIKLKPPAAAMFKRNRFEGRIMTLLRRNGIVHDREPDQAAAAAE